MALPPPTCAEMRAFYPVWGALELSAELGYTTRGHAPHESLGAAWAHVRRGPKTLGDRRPRDHEPVRHTGQAGGVVHRPQPGPAGGDRVLDRDVGRRAGRTRVGRHPCTWQTPGRLRHHTSEGDCPAHFSA